MTSGTAGRNLRPSEWCSEVRPNPSLVRTLHRLGPRTDSGHHSVLRAKPLPARSAHTLGVALNMTMLNVAVGGPIRSTLCESA